MQRGMSGQNVFGDLCQREMRVFLLSLYGFKNKNCGNEFAIIGALETYAVEQKEKTMESDQRNIENEKKEAVNKWRTLEKLIDKGAKSVTILKSPDEVYAFLRDFNNLALFMSDIMDVKKTSPSRAKWIIKTQNDATMLEWETEIVEDKSGELISWKSLDHSEVEQTGRISLLKAPGDYGTEVRFFVSYNKKSGKLSEWFNKLFHSDSETLILKDLRRLKAYLETGEVPTIFGQPSGAEKGAHKVGTH
jgi:uncharacterized membrane protein